MSEPDDEAPKSKEFFSPPPPRPPHAAPEREPLMMMDLDLDASWTFEQIFAAAASNPNSPFVLSGSDQPFSPLWGFPDDNEDRTSENAAVGSIRLADCQRLPPYAGDPDSVIEGVPGQDDKRRLPPPFLGLTPKDYLDGSCIIKERMTQALRYFKESTGERVLAQVWAPVKNGGRYVLTTSGQPFVLDPNSNGLHQYRMVSLMYVFSVDGETDGLPGRVFRQKLPEWTPNVQYYSSKEFPRLNHALNYNVQGTVALPVFEPSGQSCIGVLELIMTSQKVNYAPEVDKVCKALEAVNLKSSEILDHPSTQICNEGRQNALVEILEILTVVCETYKLPLAQTWVPCRHRNVLADGGGLKKSCSSFDGSCMGQVCMSTTDVAFYVVDAHMWGFREACAEHHLQKGQGVAGRAFASQRSCFCEDITQFCKTEYPLVHYARMFGLASCFAICLRSTHTGNDDYIMEFFLPPNASDYSDQQALLNSLLLTLKNHFKSLRVASGNLLEHEWGSVEIIKASVEKKHDLMPETALMSKQFSPPQPAILPNGQLCSDSLENKQLTPGQNTPNGRTLSEPPEAQNRASVAVNIEGGKKEKKRGKAEKTISLEVLQQYFAGSLKDAAKSLGVCPTTMKRICRQHGISRWPSRKINKVNRSLSKLKRVIESVHGGDGASFTLSTIAPNTIPVAVGSISWPATAIESNHQNSPPFRPYESPEEKSEFVNHGAPGSHDQAEPSNQILEGQVLGNHELPHQQNGFTVGEGSNRSRTGSGSREESIGTPTSHGSCQGSPSPGNEPSPQNELVVSPTRDPGMKIPNTLGIARQPAREINLSAAFPSPDGLIAEQFQKPFGGMLVEDAGSSHDLRNLCQAGEAQFDERMPEYSLTHPPCSDAIPIDHITIAAERAPQHPARPEVTSITIKATYGEDIIRFRLPLGSGIVKLQEEVAKRLKLELGTFEIKYLDDDHEWVLIACDADLQECIDISRSSGGNITRLLIHEIMPNLGSSCESSGE